MSKLNKNENIEYVLYLDTRNNILTYGYKFTEITISIYKHISLVNNIKHNKLFVVYNS